MTTHVKHFFLSRYNQLQQHRFPGLSRKNVAPWAPRTIGINSTSLPRKELAPRRTCSLQMLEASRLRETAQAAPTSKAVAAVAPVKTTLPPSPTPTTTTTTTTEVASAASAAVIAAAAAAAAHPPLVEVLQPKRNVVLPTATAPVGIYAVIFCSTRSCRAL